MLKLYKKCYNLCIDKQIIFAVRYGLYLIRGDVGEMYNVEDYVIYGASGVCRISDIKKERIKGVTREYYVLKPVYAENSTLYIPLDNMNLVERIRPVISSEELDTVLLAVPDRNDEWIENDFERAEKYKETLRSGNRTEIIEIIRVINRRQKELQSRGKHLHVADERIKREAQTPLCSEIAFVKTITPDEALKLILTDM